MPPASRCRPSKASEAGRDDGWSRAKVTGPDLLLIGVVVGTAVWIDWRLGGHVHPVLVSAAKLEEKTAHNTEQLNTILASSSSLKANVAVLVDRIERMAEEKHEKNAPKALKA
ncbi:hypothetical protein NBRC10512_007414 [Rhodotorula toruloides]|uniref:Uncharacterized protein n=1 Tax=Rhodotorula toruloides (strain NP11) TaxID=1130832 RepID=M7XH41_RHOT1|nr:uncharacterized protein RHTO_07536 [Rhodotorula toruloides NP11]EMS23194.1 hypothetical protein RHTO_07536 [Rhodotorula toruloides NP11]